MKSIAQQSFGPAMAGRPVRPSPTWTSREGVRVRDYHVSTGFWDVQGAEPTHIGVVAHETGHVFAAWLDDANWGPDGAPRESLRRVG